MNHFEATRGSYSISTDPSRLDFSVIHGYLTRSYWSPGVSREIVERAARGSLCFGIYHGDEQVGYARVITDGVTFGYVADVFVLEAHRGQGLSKWLMECISTHPGLQGFRRWMLATADAHGLYEKYGFRPLMNPHQFMERTSQSNARATSNRMNEAQSDES